MYILISFWQKVDVTFKAISEIMNLTKEYLQPNPTIRTKMNMMSTYQKIQVTFFVCSSGRRLRFLSIVIVSIGNEYFACKRYAIIVSIS